MQIKKAMSDGQLEEAARLFRLLGEPARLRLLRALMAGPRTVAELVEATGLGQANVSRHLGLLARGRFVEGKREGNFVRYRVIDRRLQGLCALMCERLEAEAGVLVRAWQGEPARKRGKR